MTAPAADVKAQQPAPQPAAMAAERPDSFGAAVRRYGTEKHLEFVAAIFKCMGLDAASEREFNFDPETQRFSFKVMKPFMGTAKPITEEAPGGAALIAGWNPAAGELEPIEGTITKTGFIFDSGIALFTKTEISKLSWGRRWAVQVALKLPGLPDILFANCTEYDQDSKTLESHLKMQKVTFGEDTVTINYSLFGVVSIPSTKEYPLYTAGDRIGLIEGWGTGVPVEGVAYKEGVRKQYPSE